MTSTSSLLWAEIASTTYDMVNQTIPFYMIFFGSVVAIFVFIALLKTFEKSFRSF